MLLIVKAVFMAIVTSVLGSNLIGFFVRFIFLGASMNKMREGIADDPVSLNFADEFAPRSRIILLQVVSGLAVLLGLFIYWKYLGIVMTVALLMAMIARLPDLIDNIKGEPMNKRNMLRSVLSWVPIGIVLWHYLK